MKKKKKYMKHDDFHKKLTSSQCQMYTCMQCIYHSVIHVYSIQPTDKVVEYLINSFKLLLLIVKRKERGGGGETGGKSGGLGGTEWMERERGGGGTELLNMNGDAFKRRRRKNV